MLEYIPFIEQFRSPGRFSWIFFYVFSIGAIVILQELVVRITSKVKRVALVSVVLALAIFEALPIQLKVANDLQAHRNAFDIHFCDGFIRSEVEKVKNENAQAIIPIPFFHYGSDLCKAWQR
ncbi:MAG: hypothetical protein R2809_00280 [Flavobacteriales bacterium]